jgi:hypothetical protein
MGTRTSEFEISLSARLGVRRRGGSRRGGRRQLAGATRSRRASRSAVRRRRHHARSAGVARLPRAITRRRTPRRRRPIRFEHAMVEVVTVVMPKDHGAGKEYDRQDENDPGDDHDPRRGHIKAGRLDRSWGHGSLRDGSRPGRRFGRFSHALTIAQLVPAVTGFGEKLAVN